jgi:hypothetical protein
MMQEHAWYNAIGSAFLLLIVVSWMAASDVFRRRAHLLYVLLLIGGLSALVLGAWHGGEMVYRHGVGVEMVREPGSETMTANAAGDASTAAQEQSDIKHGIAFYLPPLQVHVILAGLAVSLGLAAIGLSFRAGAVVTRSTPELSEIGYALDPSRRPSDPQTCAAQLHAMDTAAVEGEVLRPPVARFWLLAALVGLATAAAGAWALATFADVWNPSALWQIVAQDLESHEYRRVAHVAMGVGLVVLMLLLAMLARMAAARRFILALFVLLLLAAVGAQVWLGSLLMFDTPAGSVMKFNGGANVVEPSTRSTTSPATTRATAPVASSAPAHGPG